MNRHSVSNARSNTHDVPTEAKMLNIIALLDANEPANTTLMKPRVIPGAVDTISRQPDYFDAGMAWWIGEHGAIGYDALTWSKAASVADNHGIKVRNGILPSEDGFVTNTFAMTTWSAGMGKSNLAYMLWTIVQDAVSTPELVSA